MDRFSRLCDAWRALEAEFLRLADREKGNEIRDAREGKTYSAELAKRSHDLHRARADEISARRAELRRVLDGEDPALAVRRGQAGWVF